MLIDAIFLLALGTLVLCPVLGICLARSARLNRRLHERIAYQVDRIWRLEYELSGRHAEDERRARFEAECG